MLWKPFNVAVARGDGLVAHIGDVVAYAATDDEPAARLLSAVDAAAQNGGAGLPDQLVRIAFDVAQTVPLGVVAPTAGGLLILLRGAVTAGIHTQDGERRMFGDDLPTRVSSVAPEAVLKVVVGGRHDPSPTASPRTDLRAGVVNGGGFVLLPSTSSVDPSQRSETVVTERISFESTSMDTAVAVRNPSPVETAMAMVSTKVLTTPDGAIYPLDRAYVVGRAPLADDAVRGAKASPIVVPYDPYVSRVHAYITLEGGAVLVRDAATTSGTFIASPGAQEWTQIDSRPTRLEPGGSLRIGEWIATYHAANQR